MHGHVATSVTTKQDLRVALVYLHQVKAFCASHTSFKLCHSDERQQAHRH